MDGHHVGSGNQFVHIVNRSDVQVGEHLLGNVGVPCGHVHAESSGDTRHGLANAAKADDAKLLTVQFIAVGTIPIAFFDLPVEFADLPGEFHEQCDGVFGYGMVAVVHHVAYADAAFLGFG